MDREIPKGGRKKGSRDKQPRKVAAGSLDALAQHRAGTGLPSRVIRTQAESRALAWWADTLEPAERARWIAWLYAHHRHIDLGNAEEWGD